MSALQPNAIVTVRDFSPGFQSTPEPDTLPSGATPDAANVLVVSGQVSAVGARAVLRRRPGCALLNATAIGAQKAVDALVSFRRDTALDVLTAVCDGKLLTYDDATAAFVQVGGTAPFTAGNPTRFAFHRNQAYICDGVVNKRYNGTSLLDVGFIAPTAAPALAAVAPSSGGVTGTYEGFAVWYDSVTDHESSPSATSAAVAHVAKDRQWTKPAGAPPANVTHWRVYCRRTDTSEVNFFRAGTATVATATLTEATSDTARRDIGPAVNVNDPPPAAFAFIAVWKGYGIGVKPNDASFYVSKQDDLESWDARNVFLVQRNTPIRSGLPYGTKFIIQTDSASFLVTGDKHPFLVEDLHSEYGNVSQTSAQEVDGWFYGWDRRRGPYRTNTVDWEALGDSRIQSTLDAVNRSYLSDVRLEHFPAMNLLAWAVPNVGSSRRRTLLLYNYRLGCWHPPMTGLEYASLATFCDSTGVLRFYAGDYWGRVYELFTRSVDGTPDGTSFSATITAATDSTIEALAATFYTGGSHLAGIPVAIESPAGEWQWSRIASNTEDTLTLDTTYGSPLETVPDPTTGTWTVHVGAIRAYWTSPLWDFGDPYRRKSPYWVEFQGEVDADGHKPLVEVSYDGNPSVDESFELTLPATMAGLVWDAGLWDVGRWTSRPVGRRVPRKRRLSRTFHQVQITMRMYKPFQDLAIEGIQLTADFHARRRTASV